VAYSNGTAGEKHMLQPWIEAWELRELIVDRKVRPREAAEFFLARIERLNPGLRAFMTIAAERAMEDAARLEQMTRRSASRCRCLVCPIRSRI
jgi:Asp-tRNA(Asn)/Glu-tRNA(Gln) amidotransferase A subunit family amidase